MLTRLPLFRRLREEESSRRGLRDRTRGRLACWRLPHRAPRSYRAGRWSRRALLPVSEETDWCRRMRAGRLEYPPFPDDAPHSPHGARLASGLLRAELTLQAAVRTQALLASGKARLTAPPSRFVTPSVTPDSLRAFGGTRSYASASMRSSAGAGSPASGAAGRGSGWPAARPSAVGDVPEHRRAGHDVADQDRAVRHLVELARRPAAGRARRSAACRRAPRSWPRPSRPTAARAWAARRHGCGRRS